MATSTCHHCGMQLDSEQLHCPKCDTGRYAQNHTQTLVVDIAHNRQSLAQSEAQLDQAIKQARQEEFSALKIIVGRGLIRQEIRRSLDTALWQNRIRDFQSEPNNPGAYIIQMIKPK